MCKRGASCGWKSGGEMNGYPKSKGFLFDFDPLFLEKRQKAVTKRSRDGFKLKVNRLKKPIK